MDGKKQAFDSSQFRKVLGHLPTGVLVITANHPDGRAGMAVNAVMSVSLDPPMIAVCPALTSTTWPLIRDAGRFCMNVMAAHHEAATRSFSQPLADRFRGHAIHDRPAGPALNDAIAWIDCALLTESVAGDHILALAEVTALEAADPVGPPLIFFRGKYGTFAQVG